MPSPTPVEVRRETVVLPTYQPLPPDRNPMFLEKRVYQGSSGRVYPLPFIDRVAEKARPRSWEAIFVENEYLLVMLLPELGGRIHRIQDKTNGYDTIYHQPVIKPALVGLAGPWCSGGIEFNWPQHHRPSTFMPADVAVDQAKDGSATVWMSEHDPMARMKGMHGVRLHPGKAYVELVVRAYNRTADVQTFLWWANAAMRVHEAYQSFFPPDVTYVADHAKRAMSTFPCANGRYYGVDYGARGRAGLSAQEVPRQFVPPHAAKPASNDVLPAKIPAYRPDDLSWYANIPVPTSYMAMGSREDFCGGYDYRAKAGLIHIANHHISPGKKQWTWGNHEFGYAWDRNLTDADANGEYAPYIELMAGVYTDNQPDFSYLQPGETKTWSQFWYPIQEIGPAQHANLEAAVSLGVAEGTARVGVCVTSAHDIATVRLEVAGQVAAEWQRAIGPGRPFVMETPLPRRTSRAALTLRVLSKGREVLHYTPKVNPAGKVPPTATEPAQPSAIKSADELYVTGLHLEQYRHATRMPEAYWREALRRDPGDARCNLALGRWHLRRGELDEAERFLRASIARLVSRNPNPADGEPYYQLGLCLRLQAMAELSLAPTPRGSNACWDEAYAAFYKATWNHAWQPASFHALAEIDAWRGDWERALDHLERALRGNADNLRARNLRVIALRGLGRAVAAEIELAQILALDPLDWWAVALAGRPLCCDNQVRIDLALDCVRAGLFEEALGILESATFRTGKKRMDASLGTAPLVHYYRAWTCHLRESRDRAEESARKVSRPSAVVRKHLDAAVRADPSYCFPARVEEISILNFAIAANPKDARAPFFLGNLLYDRRRHREAIAQWERAVRLDAGNAVAWRNLGIAYHNISQQPAAARAAYERACRANERDARLLYERDQLAKRLGEPPSRRLRRLLFHPRLIGARDDLAVELCALYNQTDQPQAALKILTRRRFQPWEGGEGAALGQYVRAHLVLGRKALQLGEPWGAVEHFSAALAVPENIGESRHLLANQSDIHYWLGRAYAAAGAAPAADRHWTIAAEFRGDFQSMSVRSYSEMTYYSAMALRQLGRKGAARQLLQQLLRHATQLAKSPAVLDYFATSLPTMLLFDDDLQARQETTALFIESQARLGLGQRAAARALLREVLRRDPNHALAADLMGAAEGSERSVSLFPRRRR